MAIPTPTNLSDTRIKQLPFAYPFCKKGQGNAARVGFTDEHEFHQLLKKEPLGNYSVSPKGIWHGGIHLSEGGAGAVLDLKHGVRCIADGEVVAFRIDRAYLISQIPAKGEMPAREARYSTGFALVRHTMEFPKNNKLTFFSLYMHLQDLAGYESDKTLARPAYWIPDFRVTEFAHDKPTGGPTGAVPVNQAGIRVRATHPYGAPLCILPRGAQVSISKREGNWGQIKDTHGAQLIPPTVGGYVAPTAAINGWVFLGKEGGHAVVEEVMPDSILDRVVTLESPFRIKAGDLIGHLGRYDSLSQHTENRMAHIEVFCGEGIKTFIQQGRDWIDNHGHHPEAWKPLGLPSEPTILRIDKNTKLYKSPFNEGQDPSQTDVVQVVVLANLERSPDNRRDETVAGSDGKKRTWWRVQSADVHGHDIDGWVRQENFAGGRVTLEHAQSWIDFDASFDGPHDPAHTMFAATKAYVDYSMGADVPASAALDKLSPLMTKVYRAIYPRGDGSRAADELCVAADDPWRALRMSRLIIKHESEWANPGKWQPLIQEIEKQTGPQSQHEEEQKRIEKLVWWDDVKAGVNDLPEPDAFHIHPIGLVGNFGAGSECVPLEKAKVLALTITSGFEGGYPMNFGAISGNFDGQGISFGIVQWNAGQGTLGPLLGRMRSKNPETFRSCFGAESNYNTLESAITEGGQQALFNWAIDQQSHNPNWKVPFIKLGEIDDFRWIQIDEASGKYHKNVMICVSLLRSVAPDLMKNIELSAYCALFDLSVQQNNLYPAENEIRARFSSENPATHHDFVRIAVEERARKANQQWVSDCMSRRIGILLQRTFTHTAYGVTKSRSNYNFETISEDASKHVCGL